MSFVREFSDHNTEQNLESGGVMFSPLGRLRVAQAVRKQSTFGMIPRQDKSLYIFVNFDSGTNNILMCMVTAAPALYAPPTQYTLVPAPYSTACCEPTCCAPLDKQPRIPPPPMHPAFIY
ncbi:unnamed protein product [Leptidea sinapis]|uniref:Uncharacterized protein n=1 Tax=Leptidea sinapis TaxID=189913 RepID=A0A5E4PNE8_9NEOP|nr:unnamed protein product [Leptidea sinapis]